MRHRVMFELRCMWIVQPSVELLFITPDAEKLIERIGRVAYKSEDKITDTSHVRFIQNLVKRRHGSVIEHAYATFHIVTDRGVTHELVRHRLASFTQESTRYCNYCGKDMEFIEPPFEDGAGRAQWGFMCRSAEAAYNVMMQDRGCTPQIARSVLPTSLKAEIVVTANLWEWRHIVNVRTAKDAHPQMQAIAKMILCELLAHCPNVFGDFADRVEAEGVQE